ncbi:hypothetical protein B0H34DRAFT_348120 [Crassisporium funariophilum]|nr:hypothetical protein B0H34DRAFT_348120 [Crassisporium funariophilum]
MYIPARVRTDRPSNSLSHLPKWRSKSLEDYEMHIAFTPQFYYLRRIRNFGCKALNTLPPISFFKYNLLFLTELKVQDSPKRRACHSVRPWTGTSKPFLQSRSRVKAPLADSRHIHSICTRIAGQKSTIRRSWGRRPAQCIVGSQCYQWVILMLLHRKYRSRIASQLYFSAPQTDI